MILLLAKQRLLADEEMDWEAELPGHELTASEELLADTKWWDRMRPETKAKYLRKHPRSRKDGSFMRKHLNTVMKDKSPTVRKAAVTHPHAPLALLKKASQDKSPSVRKAAEKALQNRKKK